ncbi:hypothetical protein BCR39DRAFT_544734 [Naematelia encephala]|uniref:Maintenance of mitochondrial morphology protein 1 n=1 Tax=Naematelia encephala TaxID=71784 RepID=A0A1Y2ASK6_9TREE|nr:hypothetical protein BCR39DRAFT_544734 [Naematelia encephala]
MSAVGQIPASSGWTFTQGLILGQASFLVLVLLFVRYVVFSPSESIDDEGWRRRREERAKKTVLSTTAVPAPPASTLLFKTEYEMGTHPAESADWLNVLFAQVLQGYRNDLLSSGGEEGARQRVESWLNPEEGRLSWLDPIHVTALNLGSSFPLLSNARIRPADSQGRIRAEIDIDYLDSVSLSLSTAVLINFPRPRFAVLPVSLGVELVSIGGTMSVQLHEPVEEFQHLHVCLLPDFHLNLKTTTLLGSRAKLQDIPKLEQIIIARLRAVVQDRLVHPHHLTITLPRLLSPTASAKPIIADVGEAAVTAMSDAVKQGLSQMVNDFSGASFVPPQPPQSPSSGTVSSHSPHPSDLPPYVPRSPRISQRKITMPAGFPGSAPYAASSIHSTPLQTPDLAGPGQFRRPNHPPIVSGSSSAYRVPQTQGSVNLNSATPSVSGQSQSQSQSQASQFRFRGQFASQPGTPGGAVYSESEHRMGVLNARP